MANEYDVNPALTAVVQKYANDQAGFVADKIFRTIPVEKQLYEYRKFDSVQEFDIPNDFIGEKSQVHEISQLKSSLIPSKTKDYGLSVVLGWTDTNNKAGDLDFDVKATNAKYLTDKVLLKKEVRALQLAFLSSAYSGSQSNGGTVDYAAGLTPSAASVVADWKAILGNVKGPKFNSAVMSLSVLTALELNIGFLLDGGGNAKISTPQIIAKILGLDNIYISDVQYNSAAPGLAANIQQVVGDSVLFYRDDPSRTTADGPQNTFALQPTLMPINSWEYFDPDMGLRGSTRIKCGYSADFLILDRSESFLLTNVLP